MVNPAAVVSPRVWSLRSTLGRQAAAAWARVSWLELGSTGSAPLTAKRSGGSRGRVVRAGVDRLGSAVGWPTAAVACAAGCAPEQPPASSADATMRMIFGGERITAHPPVPDQRPAVWPGWAVRGTL